MLEVAVGSGVHRDRLDAEFAARPQDPEGDLTGLAMTILSSIL